MIQHFTKNGIYCSINVMNEIKSFSEITSGSRNCVPDVLPSVTSERLGIDHKSMDTIKKTLLSVIKSS